MSAGTSAGMSAAADASLPSSRSGAGERLFLSFSAASGLVMVGVLVAWVAVKRSGGDEELAVRDLSLDVLPTTVLERSRGGVATLLEQAEIAFAAGRIVEPRFDNALYFYRAASDQAPDDAAVLRGVERVAQWLVGQAEQALADGDFEAAERRAASIVELRPGDADALARLEHVARLGTAAAAGRQARESGDLLAAVAAWRQVLALEPASAAGRDGLRAAARALVEAGTRAASAGRPDDARSLLAAARQADAGVAGVDALAARLDSLARATQEEVRSAEVLAIRAAIRDGALLGDGADDAFALLGTFVASRPGDPLAADLRADARLALLEAARGALEAGDLALADRALDRARAEGVAAAEVDRLAADLAERRYLADFERGAWTLRAISELTVVEQVPPEYPERANRNSGGWVDLEFTVDPAGAVRDVLVREASSRVFVAPSIDAIERWRFEPTRVSGRAVPARGVLRFTFRS